MDMLIGFGVLCAIGWLVWMYSAIPQVRAFLIDLGFACCVIGAGWLAMVFIMVL